MIAGIAVAWYLVNGGLEFTSVLTRPLASIDRPVRRRYQGWRPWTFTETPTDQVCDTWILSHLGYPLLNVMEEFEVRWLRIAKIFESYTPGLEPFTGIQQRFLCRNRLGTQPKPIDGGSWLWQPCQVPGKVILRWGIDQGDVAGSVDQDSQSLSTKPIPTGRAALIGLILITS